MRDYPNQGCATNVKAEAERNYATLRALAEQQQNRLAPPHPSTSCDVSTSSKIRDGVTYIEQQVSEIHEVIGALASRLETVLTPSAPAGVEAAGSSTPSNSHLFNRLGTLADEVIAVKRRLADLLGRVEV